MLNGLIGRLILPVALVAALAVGSSDRARAITTEDIDEIFELDVTDASAKVGQPGEIVVRLKLRENYRLIEAYNNRLTRLSAQDDTVQFTRKMMPPSGREGTGLIFRIEVVPTKPGTHPINGVFRVGYIENGDTMHMVSVPLMAKVVGTD